MSPASSLHTDHSFDAESSARYDEAVNQFVTFWGDMASRWGINRTMAQIHALLYCVSEPLNTDDIMAELDISRGNANMNLRSLVDWNLVRKIRLPDSRKDFYSAEKDVWRITAQIIEERERREIKPVRQQLEDCTDTLLPDTATAEEVPDDVPEPTKALHERLENLIELMDVFDGVTKALLPLVKGKDEKTLKKLVEFAGALQVMMQNSDT